MTTSFASGDVLAVDNANNTETKKITAANAITTPINNVSQKVSGSSDAYSSSKAYSVGDMVIYNNIVYKCTTACSAASWSVNQNNFTATTLAESVSALNNDLNALGTLESVPVTTSSRMSSYGGLETLLLNSLAKGFVPYIADETSGGRFIMLLASTGTSQVRFAGVSIGFERYLAINANSAPVYKERTFHTTAETDIDVSTHTLKLYYRK